MCDQCDQKLQRIPARTSRRLKLWEIKAHNHCTILGTCLTLEELRKVIRQSGVILKDRPSDYELHALMVAHAEHNGRAARNLQKMLDTNQVSALGSKAIQVQGQRAVGPALAGCTGERRYRRHLLGAHDPFLGGSETAWAPTRTCTCCPTCRVPRIGPI